MTGRVGLCDNYCDICGRRVAELETLRFCTLCGVDYCDWCKLTHNAQHEFVAEAIGEDQLQ